MFDWLKKKELLTIQEQSDRITFLEGKVAELIGIANSKKVVACYNDKCMDYENGGCTLNKIIIQAFGRCEDAYNEDDMKEDLSKELSTRLSVKLTRSEKT